MANNTYNQIIPIHTLPEDPHTIHYNNIIHLLKILVDEKTDLKSQVQQLLDQNNHQKQQIDNLTHTVSHLSNIIQEFLKDSAGSTASTPPPLPSIPVFCKSSMINDTVQLLQSKIKGCTFEAHTMDIAIDLPPWNEKYTKIIVCVILTTSRVYVLDKLIKWLDNSNGMGNTQISLTCSCYYIQHNNATTK